MADRKSINADGAPTAVGPYAHAVKTGDLLFCSGQIPLDPNTGELVGQDDVAAQARRCMENLAVVAVAGGGELRNAVRCTVYLADMADFAAVNEVYAEYFDESGFPARVAYGVSALPRGAKVEIDAIVAL
jgi:2-iminobutanoate/2-iminopropanoate deaminase